MQKKKGISLIVLVITIIVMIILAAAIILSLNNAGIIGNANKAVDESNMDTIKAEADLKYAEYLINKDVAKGKKLEVWLNEEIQHEGYVIKVINKETVVLKEESLANAYLEGIIKKGDYVTYKAGNSTESVNQYMLEGTTVKQSTTNITASDSMNWRVLGIDNNGELLLILENTTSEKISLAGKEGYFNGEQILHDACSVFGKGQYATGARSITREDIDKITNVDYSNLHTIIGFWEPRDIWLKHNAKVTTGASEDNFDYYNSGDISIIDRVYHLGNSIDEAFTNEPFTFINNRLSYKISERMDKDLLKETDNAYKMLFVNSQDESKLKYHIANKDIRIIIDYSMEDFDLPAQSLEYGMTCLSLSLQESFISHSCLIYCDKEGYTNNVSSLNLKPVVSIDKNTGYEESTTKINEVATWDLK